MKNKTFPIPLRMEEWVVLEAQKIANKMSLDRSDVFRLILAAGTRAIVDNNYEANLPIRMKLVNQEPTPAMTTKTVTSTFPTFPDVSSKIQAVKDRKSGGNRRPASTPSASQKPG